MEKEKAGMLRGGMDPSRQAQIWEIRRSAGSQKSLLHFKNSQTHWQVRKFDGQWMKVEQRRDTDIQMHFGATTQMHQQVEETHKLSRWGHTENVPTTQRSSARTARSPSDMLHIAGI